MDISLAQFLVLSVVDAHPGPLVDQQTIADRLGLTKGTVSRQIEQAVSAGLMSVQTSSQNRRENALHSDRGRAQPWSGEATSCMPRHAEARCQAPDAADIGSTLRVLGQLNRALG